MEGIKVKDLKFKKVPLEDAKNFPCNYCGQVGFTYKWWRAAIEILKGVTLKIVLCSDECKENFLANPKAQKFLDDTIERVKITHAAKQQNLLNKN